MVSWFNGATVHTAGRFHRSLYPYIFCFQCRFALSILQDLRFQAGSVLGLEVPLLRLLEIDNIPDGIEVL